MKIGLVFNIQRFSINDGPGIRTTVFLKGCPLECKWCHNPESQKLKPELLYIKESCVGCGKCEAVCKNGVHIFDGEHRVLRDKCIACGKCEDICSINALEIAGKYVDADFVIQEALRDKLFYDTSGGGITLSGGEPFLQFDFMLEILRLAKKNGLHTCIETCGFTDREKIIEAGDYTDIFLYDWKISNPELHREYTGVSNERISENLNALNDISANVILRCPVIPGVNDNINHFKGIAHIANSFCCVKGIDVSPYHELGLSKLERLGRTKTESFSVPEKDEAESYILKLRELTDIPVKRI